MVILMYGQFGLREQKLTVTRMTRIEEYVEGKEGVMIQIPQRHLSNMVEVDVWHGRVWMPVELGRCCLSIM